MVGLLQAPHGTKLYQRLAGEGRLLDEMTGDNTDGTTNIIPKMKADTLIRGYQRILSSIYSPPMLYQRIRTFLTTYNPVHKPVRLELSEIKAFFRSIFVLGLLGSERRYYWKLFFWALRHKPAVLPLAITLSIFGYHFRKVSLSVVS